MIKRTLLSWDNLLILRDRLLKKIKQNISILWSGIKIRFKKYLWDVDWLQNILLVLLAALIVFLVINNFIPVVSTNSQKIPSSDINFKLLLILLSIVAVTLFPLAKSIARIKGIKLFLFFLAGFLFVSYWNQIRGAFTKQFDNIYNSIVQNINDIIKSIVNEKIGNPPSLSADKFEDIIQDIFVKTIGSIFTFSHILELIAIILLGIVLILFLRWLSSSSGIMILPFDDSSLESNQQGSDLHNGKAIADLLAAELHRIHHIHNLIEDRSLTVLETNSSLLGVCRENIDLCLIKGENLEKNLTQAVTISIPNQATLQIGSILLTLRQLWPWGSVQVISGSIQKYISNGELKLKLAARYEQTNHRSDIHAYELDQEIESPRIPDMVRNLAYRIALDSAPTALSTNCWEAFKFLTEALSDFYDHIRTKSLDDLDQAYAACKKANNKDKNYKRVGDLLSVIGFSYLNRDQYDKAKQALTKAMEINPNSPYVHASYGTMYYFLGQSESAFKHYNYAKELKPDLYEIYIRTGIVQTKKPFENNDQARQDFEDALILSPNNDAAQSALAWLDFLCYLDKKQKNPKEAQKFLGNACKRLENMPEDKKTHMDYSNMAIILLSKIDTDKDLQEVETKEIYMNWWKALQICQYEQPDATIYDKLIGIFYKLLTTKETYQVFEELEKLIIREKSFQNQGLIEGLSKDVKIIEQKCTEIMENNSSLKNIRDKERLETYKTSMHRFSQILDRLLSANSTKIDIHIEIDIEVDI
jgi:tetratricopeptide (TPR) repeat protein